MSLSTEIERTKRWSNLEKICWFNPNWFTPEVISGVVDLEFRFSLYG